MGGWKNRMAVGMAAALTALFLLVAGSAGHAMPVTCESLHAPAAEATRHQGHHTGSTDDRHKIASCAVPCGLCLTLLPEPGFEARATVGQQSPVPSTVAFMTGLAPAPDLGPPRPAT